MLIALVTAERKWSLFSEQSAERKTMETSASRSEVYWLYCWQDPATIEIELERGNCLRLASHWSLSIDLVIAEVRK